MIETSIAPSHLYQTGSPLSPVRQRLPRALFDRFMGGECDERVVLVARFERMTNQTTWRSKEIEDERGLQTSVFGVLRGSPVETVLPLLELESISGSNGLSEDRRVTFKVHGPREYQPNLTLTDKQVSVQVPTSHSLGQADRDSLIEIVMTTLQDLTSFDIRDSKYRDRFNEKLYYGDVNSNPDEREQFLAKAREYALKYGGAAGLRIYDAFISRIHVADLEGSIQISPLPGENRAYFNLPLRQRFNGLDDIPEVSLSIAERRMASPQWPAEAAYVELDVYRQNVPERRHGQEYDLQIKVVEDQVKRNYMRRKDIDGRSEWGRWLRKLRKDAIGEEISSAASRRLVPNFENLALDKKDLDKVE